MGYRRTNFGGNVWVRRTGIHIQTPFHPTVTQAATGLFAMQKDAPNAEHIHSSHSFYFSAWRCCLPSNRQAPQPRRCCSPCGLPRKPPPRSLPRRNRPRASCSSSPRWNPPWTASPPSLPFGMPTRLRLNPGRARSTAARVLILRCPGSRRTNPFRSPPRTAPSFRRPAPATASTP